MFDIEEKINDMFRKLYIDIDINNIIVLSNWIQTGGNISIRKLINKIGRNTIKIFIDGAKKNSHWINSEGIICPKF